MVDVVSSVMDFDLSKKNYTDQGALVKSWHQKKITLKYEFSSVKFLIKVEISSIEWDGDILVCSFKTAGVLVWTM